MKRTFAGILLLFFTTLTIAQPRVKLDTFATGVTRAVVITNDRYSPHLYVVSQNGRIFVYDSLGTRLDTFLDITDRVLLSGEQGLLGLSFHPNYNSNGYFYVNYTKKTDGATRISRFKVSSNPNRALSDSEVVILTYAQPFTNHNGGDIHFGPDGFLYISSGDGGSGGDPNNNGQNKNTYLGKLLRINVNSGSPYAIPPTNPFVGQPSVKEEIWSNGLRNPWRFSFDRLNGNMWIADVGQNAKEELNFQKASNPGGGNYGWRCYEADQGYNTSGCGPASSYIAPIYAYGHNSNGGFAIIGGYVYRGAKYPEMFGYYVFTDYTTGNFWITKNTGDTAFSTTRTQKIVSGISAFGEDRNGELFLTNVDNGLVYKLREVCSGFTAGISSSLNPCFPQQNGSITLSIAGANGTPSIVWSNGDSATTTISSLNAGNYVVTIRDAAGCVRQDSTVLSVDTLARPIITQNSNILSTTAGFSAYRWFLNLVEMPGRTSDTLQVSASGNYRVEVTDAQGCQSTSNNFGYVASGLFQQAKLSQFHIWPNPADHQLHLDLAATDTYLYGYELRNETGQMVMKQLINNKQYRETVSLSRLPRGLYILTVKLGDDSEVSQQVILQ